MFSSVRDAFRGLRPRRGSLGREEVSRTARPGSRSWHCGMRASFVPYHSESYLGLWPCTIVEEEHRPHLLPLLHHLLGARPCCVLSDHSGLGTLTAVCCVPQSHITVRVTYAWWNELRRGRNGSVPIRVTMRAALTSYYVIAPN